MICRIKFQEGERTPYLALHARFATTPLGSFTAYTSFESCSTEINTPRATEETWKSKGLSHNALDLISRRQTFQSSVAHSLPSCHAIDLPDTMVFVSGPSLSRCHTCKCKFTRRHCQPLAAPETHYSETPDLVRVNFMSPISVSASIPGCSPLHKFLTVLYQGCNVTYCTRNLRPGLYCTRKITPDCAVHKPLL